MNSIGTCILNAFYQLLKFKIMSSSPLQLFSIITVKCKYCPEWSIFVGFSKVNWILLKCYFNFRVFFFPVIIIFVFSLHGRHLEVMGARKNRAHERDTRRGTREHLPERPTKIICRSQSNYQAATAWSVKNVWQETIDFAQAKRAKVFYIYILGLSDVNISKVIWF